MTSEGTDDQTPMQPSADLAGAQSLAVGDRVRVIELPPYVKTADSMPMLRPPHVIKRGEEGIILERRSGSYWSVRLTKGVFLLESRYLERLNSPSE